MIAPMDNVVRLYFIEGQRLFAKALCAAFALEADIKIVGESSSVSETALAKAFPTFILLDVDGSEAGLSEDLAVCREAAPKASLCVLSMRPQPEIMLRCLAAGAQGFVIKDTTPSELLRAVRLISAGETFVDARVAGEYLRRCTLGNGRSDRSELSSRETEVIVFIAQGLANKEISARLNLSEKTIKNHISRIFAKLNFTGRTQAAVHALKLGLV